MNGQYLGGRPITVSYSFKKDGQKGERHGSAAERRLADLGKKNNVLVTGFLPNSSLLALAANMPPLPQGFTQASSAPSGAAPAGGVPSAPGPPAPQFNPPPGAPPGFANGMTQGPGFGPPPGMAPPPAEFGR
jgi:splicing factor 3B subunit 4